MNRYIEEIPVALIKTNPHQPRQSFDEKNIQELAKSIKENGLIQPIIVRKMGEEYELVAGERRLRAIRYLNKDSVSAIIENYDKEKSATVALIENIQRENLSPIEEALAYQKLIDEHDYTQGQLAQSLGKAQSTIANKMRLLSLSDKVKDKLFNKEITERHGRALLKIENLATQEKLLQRIIDNNLNVAQTEKIIDARFKKPKKGKDISKRIISKIDYRLEINTIKQALSVVEKNGTNVELNISEPDEDGVKIEIILKK